ncbi:pentatricopeptide repeat-containing protein At2g22410, mitochondrial [Humulus lupulus]|uniref:pentatricopeptide repeat-containing protein At2g22410, mitochondrial n=1 Tax=Humulus lupulus TaxID=3486 RepID=UPI002B412E08|nr:pentatricopeptide repeat-containing protein At2g22410, mitochondrial [Humulus lupulus]XP_062076947.1 pentatricopeptide repeat-containing protein At2g22410, mitochondrial [Humulus lupulus]XP_062076948.1 pentatricopeptide repeat-containing protein At2g22410, mitochondrial [Humulus lupulus]XP_062076949.1 pentatricopeptide repeat-containing protein At2g22410, mitochondrial [Humulus lupulus]XP_062076950.1 pentatricopeptide repeat-containing protein At2g22410, mitochondrial [Humulus lupulus]XP_06
MTSFSGLGGGFRYHRRLPTSFSYPFLSLIHTRSSIPSHKHKPATNWNITHALVQANPLLSLLECSKSISHLKQIQARMTITGLITDPFASSRLIAFCALSQLRNHDYGTKILFNTENPNVFSWNVMIRGYLESESPWEAVVLYKRMLGDGGSRPDKFTYPLLLKVCALLQSSLMGFQVLGHVLQLGFCFDLFVHNAMIHMLVSCEELDEARQLFDESFVRDLVSWNSLITGYARAGLASEALRLYQGMEADRVKPDEVTMVGLVSSCAQLGDLNKGREFHRLIEVIGLNLTAPLGNALMDMYVKCGNLESAQKIFHGMVNKTIVSWTTMIVGYAKFGFFDVARELLYEMPEKNVVPWNALISGYVQAKRGKEALALFYEMQASNIKPDEITMVGCLSACSQLGALDIGMWIHRYVEKHLISSYVSLRTALVDMYAKCGNITKALQVFQEMAERNSLTWTAIICGLAAHGQAHDAVSYFEKMIDTGLVPDDITFIGVLSACCHGGLVEEGRKYFSQMSSRFHLSPNRKHYSCMVDLLGRACLLEEAEELIKCMPIKADAVVWGALFFACRMHKNITIGERSASKLLELDPHDSGNYILLASMYVEANMWEEAAKVRKMMKDRGVEKTPGCSSIEANGIVHEFTVGDHLHPQSKLIYDFLVLLTREIETLSSEPDYLTFRDSFMLGSDFG